MAETPALLLQLKRRNDHIQRLLSPSLTPSTGSNLFAGRKFQVAAKAMRSVAPDNQPGANNREQISRLSNDLVHRFQNSNQNLHVSTKPAQEGKNWGGVERVFHAAGGSTTAVQTKREVPALPGEMRAGSIIPRMETFPKPGQSADDFKQQIQSSSSQRSTPAVETPVRRAPLTPGSRLYSKVEEVTSRAAPKPAAAPSPEEPAPPAPSLRAPPPPAAPVQRQTETQPQPKTETHQAQPEAPEVLRSVLSNSGLPTSPIIARKPEANTQQPTPQPAAKPETTLPAVNLPAQPVAQRSVDAPIKRAEIPAKPAATPTQAPVQRESATTPDAVARPVQQPANTPAVAKPVQREATPQPDLEEDEASVQRRPATTEPVQRLASESQQQTPTQATPAPIAQQQQPTEKSVAQPPAQSAQRTQATPAQRQAGKPVEATQPAQRQAASSTDAIQRQVVESRLPAAQPVQRQAAPEENTNDDEDELSSQPAQRKPVPSAIPVQRQAAQPTPQAQPVQRAEAEPLAGLEDEQEEAQRSVQRKVSANATPVQRGASQALPAAIPVQRETTPESPTTNTPSAPLAMAVQRQSDAKSDGVAQRSETNESSLIEDDDSESMPLVQTKRSDTIQIPQATRPAPQNAPVQRTESQSSAPKTVTGTPAQRAENQSLAPKAVTGMPAQRTESQSLAPKTVTSMPVQRKQSEPLQRSADEPSVLNSIQRSDVQRSVEPVANQTPGPVQRSADLQSAGAIEDVVASLTGGQSPTAGAMPSSGDSLKDLEMPLAQTKRLSEPSIQREAEEEEEPVQLMRIQRRQMPSILPAPSRLAPANKATVANRMPLATSNRMLRPVQRTATPSLDEDEAAIPFGASETIHRMPLVQQVHSHQVMRATDAETVAMKHVSPLNLQRRPMIQAAKYEVGTASVSASDHAMPLASIAPASSGTAIQRLPENVPSQSITTQPETEILPATVEGALEAAVGGAKKPDLNALAEEIFPIVKRLLAIEADRFGSSFH